MRQVTKNGLLTMAAAGSVLAAMSGGTAYADAGAQGAAKGSPGVLSGNNVQVPIDVPVNVCGNTVNVVGALNPASGNACENGGGQGSSGAEGGAEGSPGVGSGNNVQVPIDVPVNACGNNVSVVGALNPVSGNECGDVSEKPGATEEKEKSPGMTPAGAEEPVSTGSSQPESQLSSSVSQGTDELAETGGGQELGVAGALGAGLMVGGYVLYRRARVMQR